MYSFHHFIRIYNQPGRLIFLPGTVCHSFRPIQEWEAEAFPSTQAPDPVAMDLGATVCTPETPSCAACPWSRFCGAHRDGVEIPRSGRNKLSTRYGVVFFGASNDQVLMRPRPDDGFLGGMLEFPASGWDAKRARVWPHGTMGHAPG